MVGFFLAPLWRAFYAGFMLASWGALVGYSLMLDGSHFRAMGAEAERWTSQELRKMSGWWVLDAVEFADRDVDHVAGSNGLLLAAETKWTSRPLRITPERIEGLYCDGITQAENGAKRIERLLRSKGVLREVVPVLVLWGPGVPEMDGGYQRVGDVRVVVGKQADEWRDRLGRVPQSSQPTEGAREAIETYVRRFDEHRRLPLFGRVRAALGLV
jgi:hypothetical protein